jgi:hypothetical protein
VFVQRGELAHLDLQTIVAELKKELDQIDRAIEL